MTTPEAVPKGYTEGPWYAGKVSDESDWGQAVTIGDFEAEHHYEGTICEVVGANHDAEANAALIVQAVNKFLKENT